MSDMPERIWAISKGAVPGFPQGVWDAEEDEQPGETEYIRLDAHTAAVEAARREERERWLGPVRRLLHADERGQGVGYAEAMMDLDNIASALPATPPQEDPWQPIETAPRDGAMFLVCLPRMMNLVVRARRNKIHNCFVTDMTDKGVINPTFFHPGDLWCAIPAPPSTPQQEGEE